MKRNNAHKQLVTLVTCAMLIAIQVVLVRFCSIQTPFQRISFGFVPMSMAGISTAWVDRQVPAKSSTSGMPTSPVRNRRFPVTA